MNVGRFVRTVARLKPEQVVFQVVNRFWRPKFRLLKASSDKTRGGVLPTLETVCGEGRRLAPWTEKPVSLTIGAGGAETLTFLNISDTFRGWNVTDHGMLWAYNLNYMDWLNQTGMTAAVGALWIDRFIADARANRVGFDPYPTALRVINWAKFFARFPAEATPDRLDWLWSQAIYLSRRLERHLLGNHLLEDYFALAIVGGYFGDKALSAKGLRGVKCQLREQLLADGGHYEQSPMYHAILTDRLLDCVNFDPTADAELRSRAAAMAGYLEAMVWPDGSLPSLNDTADGIAPAAMEIIAYAHRLAIEPLSAQLGASGYRRLRWRRLDAIVDVGEITATYQPGHSHADALSFELRVDGRPLIVDTGITTYDKNARRDFERSTAAHNTVTIEGRDSAETWGGFRVGRRYRSRLLEDSTTTVAARLSTGHERSFGLDADSLTIIDSTPQGKASQARLHFAPGITISEPRRVANCSFALDIEGFGRLTFDGAEHVTVEDCAVAREYNRPRASKVVVTRFSGSLTTHVTAR